MSDRTRTLTQALRDNEDMNKAGLVAVQEERFGGDATRLFLDCTHVVAGIVRCWAAEHDRADTESGVEFWGVDGNRVVLRWRDGYLIATEDDGPAVFYERHEGPDDIWCEGVWYERYDVGSGYRLCSGVVHPVTRRLV